MSREVYELAKTGLSIYAPEMSDHFVRLREELAGALSAPLITLEALRQQTQVEATNFSLIEELVRQLPGSCPIRTGSGNNDYYWGEEAVYTGNPYIVKMVQHNALWWGGQLYYVVGQQEKNKKWTELIFASAPLDQPTIAAIAESDQGMRKAVDKPRPILRASVSRAQLEAYQNRDIGSVTSEAVRDLYAPDLGRLMVWGGSEGSIRIFNPVIPRHNPDRLARYGLTCLADYPITLSSRLENGLMRDFGIFDHLNRLATCFDVVPQLDQLLERSIGGLPEGS